MAALVAASISAGWLGEDMAPVAHGVRQRGDRICATASHQGRRNVLGTWGHG